MLLLTKNSRFSWGFKNRGKIGLWQAVSVLTYARTDASRIATKVAYAAYLKDVASLRTSVEVLRVKLFHSVAHLKMRYDSNGI